MVSLISFNILHPSCASKQRYPWCKQSHLDWSYRLDKIISILKQDFYDLILLQEANSDTIQQDFADFLSDYEMVYQKQKKGTMVCATLVRRDKFQLISSITGTRTLLTWIQPKDGEKILVVNLHLEARDEKLRIKHLQNLVQKYPFSENPLQIIAGDFNDEPDSKTLEILIDSGFKYGYRKLPRATYGSVVIDHLFCSPLYRVGAKWDDKRCIPNSSHPSDHIPVVFTLVG